MIFLGAPLLRVLRNVAGPRRYWVAGALITGIIFAVGQFPVASLILGVWIMVGMYSELEERGHAGLISGLLSTFVGTIVFLGVPQAIGLMFGFNLSENLKEILKEAFDKMQTGSAGQPSWIGVMQIDFNAMWGQVPSIVFLLMMISLAFALMFDRKTAFMFNLKFEKIASQVRLLEFRLPDSMIWITMIAFLLSFLNLNQPALKTVAMNIFNIAMGLWFFQGLAVLEVSFIAFRIGSIVRLLVYLIVVGQLFFLLSAVGIIDYWADFRRRIRNLRAPEKGNKNGEHV